MGFVVGSGGDGYAAEPRGVSEAVEVTSGITEVARMQRGTCLGSGDEVDCELGKVKEGRG